MSIPETADLSQLPHSARLSVLEYIDFLKNKYKPETTEFSSTDFRGTLNINNDILDKQIKSLRNEWERVDE